MNDYKSQICNLIIKNGMEPGKKFIKPNIKCMKSNKKNE